MSLAQLSTMTNTYSQTGCLQKIMQMKTTRAPDNNNVIILVLIFKVNRLGGFY